MFPFDKNLGIKSILIVHYIALSILRKKQYTYILCSLNSFLSIHFCVSIFKIHMSYQAQ